MLNRTSRLMNYLFHPVFIPAYVFTFLLFSPGTMSLLIPLNYKLILLAVILFSTALFPLSVFYLMLRQRLITSVRLEKREERLYPLIAVAIFYYLAYYLLKGISIVSLFSLYLLGATLITVLLLIVNFFYKPSLHMVALGGCAGFFLGFLLISDTALLVPFLISILISGMVGFSRLLNASHTPGEVYSGFFIGMTTMILLLCLL